MTETVAVQPTLQSLAQGFWSQLQDDRAARAELRRCRTTSDVRFTPAYHRLRRAMAAAGLRPFEPRLAAAAALLAHATENDASARPGQQLGRAEGERAFMSGLRFRRLVASVEPDELMRGWIRAARLLGGRINVGEATRMLVYWGDRTRRELAQDYYDTAPNEK